jgi:hypothetical protein
VQFLAEPGDQEQPVVNAQPEAQDRGDVKGNTDTPVNTVSSRSAVNDPRIPSAPMASGMQAAIRLPKITSSRISRIGKDSPSARVMLDGAEQRSVLSRWNLILNLQIR